MSTTVGAILEAERESAKAAIGLALRQASLDPSKPGASGAGASGATGCNRAQQSFPAYQRARGRQGLPPREAYSIGEIRDRARA